MDNLSQDEYFAQTSKGISDNIIYQNVISQVSSLQTLSKMRVADIGCGEGQLLSQISTLKAQNELFGIDIVDYKTDKPFTFIKQNFNDKFVLEQSGFDITMAIEVIEHLENPRHFIREMVAVTKKGGHLIISTPNPYSLLSLLSFVLKGFHSSFGPKNYPAHITPVTSYQMSSMISEIEGVSLLEMNYINNGRIPGTKKHWNKVFPFLKGKRFSDNYYCVIKKD